MSDDVATPDGVADSGPPNQGRRKLWVAAGVAGITGIVGLAALGGVAARDDSPGTPRSDAQANARQNVSDAGPADDAGGMGKDSKGEDDRSGDDRRGKDDRRDHKGKAKDVPCHTDKLIQAIVHANETGGGVLELAKGCTYELTRSEHGNGLPVIKESVVLKGHDTRIVRAATADYFRILNVGRGGHLTLKHVTVKGGQTEARKMVPPPTAGLAPSGATTAASAPVTRPALAAPRPAATAAPEVSPAPATGGGPAAAAPKGTPAPAPDIAPTVSPLGSVDGAGILVQRGGTADIEHSWIVQNHAGLNGGGIANYGTTNIRKSSVERNSAAVFGGGVFNAGVLRVEDSKIEYNSAGAAGGGIANGSAPNGFTGGGGTVWVWKSKIDHNRAGVGGGLYDNHGTTTLTQSQVNGNTGTEDVGGIFVEDAGKLYLERVLVAGNFTDGLVGGVGVEQATAVIEHSLIKENESRQSSGGLGNFIGFVTLQDTEIVANRATGPGAQGGGIFNQGGVTTLVRTKVAHNYADQPPGGIWTSNDGVKIDKKSAVKDNRPTNCQGSPVIPDNCFG
ncbi:right-handed parallel beta-helix repeat-containing protein [Micromonospora sp. NPDC126480]|uniref:right-handed parallel beta-helix repeat-containing protein n=1 Tax=Micromonospora sp. NPDC126480 TaxID=3155312 RepID=UPI003319C07C